MKKTLTEIIAGIACLFLIVCLFKISSLENQLQNHNASMNDRLSQLNNDIHNISSQVKNSLEEQSNLLTSSSWEYGELNIDQREIELKCRVSLKEYNPTSTEVLLVYKNKQYPMKLNGTQYTLSLNLPLFDDTEIPSVMLVDEGNIRTQALNWYLSPRIDYLPEFYSRFEGSSALNSESGVSSVTHRGLVVIDTFNHKTTLQAANLIYLLDGKEMKKTAIDLSYQAQLKYLKNNPNIPMPAPESFANGDSSQIYYYLDESTKIPSGSTLEMVVEVVDQHDFHYLLLFDLMKVNEQGEPDFDVEKMGLLGNVFSIVDALGNQLWLMDESLYQ